MAIPLGDPLGVNSGPLPKVHSAKSLIVLFEIPQDFLKSLFKYFFLRNAF